MSAPKECPRITGIGSCSELEIYHRECCGDDGRLHCPMPQFINIFKPEEENMDSPLIPFKECVVAKIVKHKKFGAVLLPDGSMEMDMELQVLAIGPGVKDIHPDLMVGDRVVFSPMLALNMKNWSDIPDGTMCVKASDIPARLPRKGER